MMHAKVDRFDRHTGARIPMVVGALCAIALLVSTANAAGSATTLHFFDRSLTNTFTTPSGHPVGNGTPPAGSSINITAIGYAGTSKHHAKTSTASIHLACVVTTAPNAVCFAQVGIGGSMLLANQFTVNLAGAGNPFASVKINGGIGEFAHAHGSVNSASAGAGNSNVTITYSG